MEKAVLLQLLLGLLAVVFSASEVKAEDPYKFYTWTVTYGTLSPLGVPQQVILINGQFPGPRLDVVTNDNIILNLINKLDQPFLLTWNGIKQRKNSWQDGVLGTNCPIPPNSNYTYKIQAKDRSSSSIYTYLVAGLVPITNKQGKHFSRYSIWDCYHRPLCNIETPKTTSSSMQFR